MKKLIYLSFAALMMSCSGFLDRAPVDALSPSTFWKTEIDANMAATGCYNGWRDGADLLYLDCASDIGYNNFRWEGYTPIGNGSFSPSYTGKSYYSYTTIRRCNEFLAKISEIPFASESDKTDLTAQVKFIRSFQYFKMLWNYGGVQIVENYATSEESQTARNSEEEVLAYILADLEEITVSGVLRDVASERGRVSRGAALALKMRVYLYYDNYQKALDAAKQIETLNYSLDSDYANLFTVAGQSSSEIILAYQYIPETSSLNTVGRMYSNADGGWSSIVPTQALIDTYETADGLTIDEAAADGSYNVSKPYVNRDPRLYNSVILPGFDWVGTGGTERIFNPLDKSSADYISGATNASKTGVLWRKYTDPAAQYANMWRTNTCPIIFRYAEVLLTIAETKIELGIIDNEMYSALDKIRTRAGMPVVDRAKYNNQASLRELLRRERCVELAGEGVRRADILRWKDASGQILAMTLLNKPAQRIPIGLAESKSLATGSIDFTDQNEQTRALFLVDAEQDAKRVVETRRFAAHNRYFPFAQKEIDTNPKMVQNSGY